MDPAGQERPVRVRSEMAGGDLATTAASLGLPVVAPG